MSDYFGGDDELIERLRQTLKTEAAALRPSPEEQLAGRYQAPGRVLPFRPRWPHGLIAVAAAAAIAVAVIEWPGGGHPVRVVSPATSPGSVVQTPAPTTVPNVASGGSSPATTPTTSPAVPVPASFAAQSVTFVSSQRGWVLGTVPCGAANCLEMATTDDGGHSWSAARAPSTTVSSGATVSVRFANGLDGWVYLNSSAAGPSQLWSTHDGGSIWLPVRLAALAGSGQIGALEASGGLARLAIIGASGPGVALLSTPVGTDVWTASATGVPLGAGPVPSTQLILQRDNGWVLENDRTVVGGATLNASGQWQAWNPPCANANGVGELAVSSPGDLVAICAEGEWGTPGQPGATAGSEWLFISSDGGSTFHAVGPLPSGDLIDSTITTSAPGTIVGGGATILPGSAVHASGTATASGQGAAATSGLVATFNGGSTWQTVYQASPDTNWVDVGFTNLLQGVAIGVNQSGIHTLVMTRDGGHTWAPVDFGATP